ncbi:MAG: hypothetical protein AAGI71_08895 [Bacteroidota bacterium]
MFDFEDYFRGDVTLIGKSLLNSKYLLHSTKTVIKVKNHNHVRLIWDQYGWLPEVFEMVAPMRAVKIVTGHISEADKTRMTRDEYNQIRSTYQHLRPR